MKRKVLFITATRADFGKMKSLLMELEDHPRLAPHIFITGMHLHEKYGATHMEVTSCGFKNTYKYINQNQMDTMDAVLAKTVSGLSDFVKETKPDMIVVHGDRIEAFAGAIVGSLNNILVSHLEGGELSGTIDELIRHAVTKMSHVHFVANSEAQARLLQLGERSESVFVIGSPDLDIMASSNLPTLESVKKKYEFGYEEYAIALFHPVTTEVEQLPEHSKVFVDSLMASGDNFIVIYPNNDHGSNIILREYQRLHGRDNFRILPSMRFEFFLTLMRNAKYLIGNSSSGIRETPFYGVPSVNLGTRQHNRGVSTLIINADLDAPQILRAIETAKSNRAASSSNFGDGHSTERFVRILSDERVWCIPTQKHFVDFL